MINYSTVAQYRAHHHNLIMKGVAIVTGFSGNPGHAVSAEFLADGYKVIGPAVPDDPVTILAADQNFETPAVDLPDETSAYHCINSIIETINRLMRLY